jgi:hypothetical protein
MKIHLKSDPSIIKGKWPDVAKAKTSCGFVNVLRVSKFINKVDCEKCLKFYKAEKGLG